VLSAKIRKTRKNSEGAREGEFQQGKIITWDAPSGPVMVLEIQ